MVLTVNTVEIQLSFCLWTLSVWPFGVSRDNSHLMSVCVTCSEMLCSVCWLPILCSVLGSSFCLKQDHKAFKHFFSSLWPHASMVVKKEEKKITWFYHLNHMILQLWKLLCQGGYWEDNFSYQVLWVISISFLLPLL